MPSPLRICSYPCEESDWQYVEPTILRYLEYLNQSAPPRWHDRRAYWELEVSMLPHGDGPSFELRMKNEIALAISRHAPTLDAPWKDST